MAELEIDQSNLPRVQEVCQCFAVLEDGALAHNLQEQEIEQYYTTNVLKNQLVQNDIRVAKKLQDEEEEQQAQQSALQRQASRQLEEQDFEYARVIQEELQRCAEETRRRELDDEMIRRASKLGTQEIAKRLQEEEEENIRRRSKGSGSHSEGSTSDPALLSQQQHTYNNFCQGEEQYPSTTTRWRSSTSYSDITGPQTYSPRGLGAQKNTTSWSNQGHPNSIRQIRNELREPLSENSDDSDTVFSEQLSQRLNERFNTAPPRQRASLHQPQERNYRRVYSRRIFSDEFRGYEEGREEWDEDFYENGDLNERRPKNQDKERKHRDKCEIRGEDTGSQLVEFSEKRRSRSESVRHSNRDFARTWSYKDSPDKHVRFRDDKRSTRREQSESSQVWKMLARVLKERGVPVKLGGNGAPLQIRPQSRDSQVLHGSEVSYGDSQPHQRAFHRAASTRHSFHGDIRERKRLSYRENSGRDHREDRDRHHDNGEIYEIRRRDSDLVKRERQGSRRWREHKYTNNDERGERNVNNYRVRRTASERRHLHRTTEETLSSEEEQDVERRVNVPRRRAPGRSQSLSSSSSSRASTRDRSRRTAAGAPLQPELSETNLSLGELQQVLEDEELALKLQEEEEKLFRRNSQPSQRCSYPEGDFRVAQVAQDEEIARFMQKQEIKSKRRSRELEGPESWREHRAMIDHHDRRAARERQVQRERLDSEGLPSPAEDCSPENLPPSPTATTPSAQQIRNIAEELDPTFQARRQDTMSLQVGQIGPASPPLPMPQSGLNQMLEEPTFIPPTKRQTDKSGRSKSKEKKENCKQQ